MIGQLIAGVQQCVS